MYFAHRVNCEPQQWLRLKNIKGASLNCYKSRLDTQILEIPACLSVVCPHLVLYSPHSFAIALLTEI